MTKKKKSARPLLIAGAGLAAVVFGGADCGGSSSKSVDSGISIAEDFSVAFENDSGLSILDADGGTAVDGGTH